MLDAGSKFWTSHQHNFEGNVPVSYISFEGNVPDSYNISQNIIGDVIACDHLVGSYCLCSEKRKYLCLENIGAPDMRGSPDH